MNISSNNGEIFTVIRMLFLLLLGMNINKFEPKYVTVTIPNINYNYRKYNVHCRKSPF